MSDADGAVATATVILMNLPSRSSTPSRGRSKQTVFVAHKQNSVFGAPSAASVTKRGSTGRSSWKTSWGVEPPSWQTRSSRVLTEAFSDPDREFGEVSSSPLAVRDVFTGRQSLDPNDDSDWEDMDQVDERSTFVGGLGQSPAHLMLSAVPGIASSHSGMAHPPSPSLRSKRELPLTMGTKTRPPQARTKRARPTSAPAPPRASASLQPNEVAGLSRSATLRASPTTTPLLTLHGDNQSASVLAMEGLHGGVSSASGSAMGSALRTRRGQMPSGRTGQNFQEITIEEEDEDEFEE